jgi:hypothetical protein
MPQVDATPPMAATQLETAGRRAGTVHAAALGAADWLCLSAAPTFATMALLTGVLGGGPPYLLCSAVQDSSPLSGMILMYLLMSVFHSAPWVKLMSRHVHRITSIDTEACVVESGADGAK